jgi:putative effector of murein hydrolase
MLPSVVAVGTSSPACTMPLKTVAIGVPVLQATKASGLAAFTFSICAATLTSVMLKCARSTMVMPAFLYSGRLMFSSIPRSASWPVASLEVMIAIRFQPCSRKYRNSTFWRSWVETLALKE